MEWGSAVDFVGRHVFVGLATPSFTPPPPLTVARLPSRLPLDRPALKTGASGILAELLHLPRSFPAKPPALLQQDGAALGGSGFFYGLLGLAFSAFMLIGICLLKSLFFFSHFAQQFFSLFFLGRGLRCFFISPPAFDLFVFLPLGWPCDVPTPYPCPALKSPMVYPLSGLFLLQPANGAQAFTPSASCRPTLSCFWFSFSLALSEVLPQVWSFPRP